MVLGLLAAACGEGPVEGVPDAGGADAAPVVQGSEATAELVINEISPAGDWIEIANRSSEALDLADYILTDSPDRIDHYVFLDGSLAPGELRVIEPDSFGLGIAEQVHLLTSTGLGVDGRWPGTHTRRVRSTSPTRRPGSSTRDAHPHPRARARARRGCRARRRGRLRR
jgi:hypothetical protein